MNIRLKYIIGIVLVCSSFCMRAHTSQITTTPGSTSDKQQILPTYGITIQGLHETFDFQYSGKIFSNPSILSLIYLYENKIVKRHNVLLKFDIFTDFKSIFLPKWQQLEHIINKGA